MGEPTPHWAQAEQTEVDGFGGASLDICELSTVMPEDRLVMRSAGACWALTVPVPHGGARPSRRRDASVTWCVLQIRGKPSIDIHLSISAWVAQGDDCRMVASWIGPEVNEEGGRWRRTQWQQQEHRSAAVSCWRRTTPLAPLMPSYACCRSIYTDAAILSKFCFTTFLICCINFGGMLQCLDNLFK